MKRGVRKGILAIADGVPIVLRYPGNKSKYHHKCSPSNSLPNTVLTLSRVCIMKPKTSFRTPHSTTPPRFHTPHESVLPSMTGTGPLELFLARFFTSRVVLHQRGSSVPLAVNIIPTVLNGKALVSFGVNGHNAVLFPTVTSVVGLVLSPGSVRHSRLSVPVEHIIGSPFPNALLLRVGTVEPGARGAPRCRATQEPINVLLLLLGVDHQDAALPALVLQ
mmetsp:Transcript_29306/g.81920  ORF Transcript_29306/g.81920 Transcript_29306/m.81920 type:complete len:220 (-) Transcript_29306:259-918(-)